MTALGHGMSREQALDGFANSAEFKALAERIESELCLGIIEG